MKNNKFLRTALVAALVLTVMLSVTGGTIAWFTDSVESNANTIAAGNLDMVVEYKTSLEDEWAPLTESTKLFKEDALYEPGYTEIVHFRVSNAGSLAFKYSFGVNVNSETTSTNVFNEEFSLKDYLEVGCYVMDESLGQYFLGTMFGTRESAISQINSVNGTGFQKISALDGAIYKDRSMSKKDNVGPQLITLVLTMPETVGNEANHKTGAAAPAIELGVKLEAAQLMEEADSFGINYDADARYPSDKDPALNPDDGSTPVNGDTYEYGDYTYTFDTDEGGWYVGRVSDTSKTEYGPILESINGEPVVMLYQTFMFCSKMTNAPAIPDGVQKLDMTFRSCSALTEAPVIPDSVTSIVNAFQYCTALTTAPVIPDSVTSLNGAFNGCTALTTAPVIPASVVRLYDTFSGCTSLTGTITINTNGIDNNTGYFDGTCRQCFNGVDMTNITLAGAASKDVLNLIGATGNNWTPIQ